MRYFTEIADYQTYQGAEADFHFNFNANSGGGQSRLGGRFYDVNGGLSTPIQLNGRVAVFAFPISGNIIQLADSSVEYEIKPRDEGNTNMKLGVGSNHNPSEAIAAFLMLPKPCGVKKACDINTSVLNGNNYWLQSMWLDVDTSTEGKAIFMPKDCIISGGIDKQGQGYARYFSIDFAKRFADVISAANNNELDGVVLSCVRHFAAIYKGEKTFVFDESVEAIKAVMKHLSSKYPEKYSGTLDPLMMIRELANLKDATSIKVDGRSDILAAIRAKPFILLAGMSGTGKTRIVRQLARGCCPRYRLGTTDDHPLYNELKPGNFELISVRPNWHDSTELMGYVTRITETKKPKYVLTTFVKFLVKAWLHKDVPFFLCLDEMNLAPVEQYFSEYLSKIETRKLFGGEIMTDVLVEFPDEILDSVLSEISREIPLVVTAKVTGGDEKPEVKKRDKDSLHKMWDEFLADWPISRLREIGLEEYTKAGSTDTFTYALEAKFADLGSIWGGSAFKFGIFSRDPNGKLKDYNPNSKQIGTSEYAWYRKFGLTTDAAWNTVKEKIVSIAEAAARGDFAAVDKIDFPHVVKWKIAFLYQDRKNIKIVDIYKREWILLLTSGMPQNASFAERYLKLNEDRMSMDVFEWDDNILTKRRAELLASDGDFDSDEEEVSTPADAWVQSPILEMIKRDKGIRIPSNLVVMGTVNMDETTCSFPRKVLDRAMTFELNDFDVDSGLESNPDTPLGSIKAENAKGSFTHGWQVYAAAKTDCDRIKPYLVAVNDVLNGTPFKFAYRTRDEVLAYCVERMKDGTALPVALDEATGMKILSRIEGDEQIVKRAWLEKLQSAIADGLKALCAEGEESPKKCAEKLTEMLKRLIDTGFTSFWA